MSGTTKQKYPELPPEMLLAIFEEFLPHLDPDQIGQSMEDYEKLMQGFGQGEHCIEASVRAIFSRGFRSTQLLLLRPDRDPELPQ
jgi:hypothetical protein